MACQSPPNVYLARQPIYDRRLRVYGYELLYRSSEGGGAGEVSNAQSADTIVRAVSEIGLERLVKDVPAFINIPSYLLSDSALEVLPPERVIIEILEDTEPTTEALRAAHELAAKGYRLALDDYVFGSAHEEFLPACKIVKVDLLGSRKRTLPDCVQHLKKLRKRVVAEKVEAMDVYARCQALGFDYFQGYFFARPDIVSTQEVPANRTVLIHLLTRLQDPRVTLNELERNISSDVSLAYRLLRLVNSACINQGAEVESVRGAMLLLGLEKVVALVSLLAMSSVNDKPTELMVIAMVRAKMCEGVALARRSDRPETHFTLGLLSVLDSMFDSTMKSLVDQLPITDELRAALVDPKSAGSLGETLSIALAFEAGNWSELETIWEQADVLSDSYVSAVRWADEAKLALAA